MLHSYCQCCFLLLLLCLLVEEKETMAQNENEVFLHFEMDIF